MSADPENLLRDELLSDNVNLRDILREAQRRGIHRHKIWQHILKTFRSAEHQKKWTDWRLSNDREEIRLRLKVLLQADELETSQIDFIRFFFRASDPLLYQLSARIMGMKLKEHEELDHFFQDYCKKRNIAMDEPVVLNNQRTRRRSLLVRSAEYAQQKTGSIPIHFQEADELSDADISIMFASCGILLKSGDTQCAEYAKKLLHHRFEKEDPIRDRNMMANACMLISGLVRNGVDAECLLDTCLNNIIKQYRNSEHFADRLQALFLIDELAEHAVQLDADVHTDGVIGDFLNGQIQHWRFSFDLDDPVIKEAAKANVSIVHQLQEKLPYTNNVTYYGMFAESVMSISNEQHWRTLSPQEKAFRAFYVIEYCISTEITDAEEVFLMFRSNQLISGDLRSNDVITDSILGPVIGRLLVLEPSLRKQLFDPQLIHRLGDPGLLPSLLPSDVNSDFLPVIADAVEHDIRLRVSSHTDFQPDYYLYQLMIRRPHPRFFRILAELSNGREYKGADGISYPLHHVAQMYAGELSGQVHNSVELTPFIQGLVDVRKQLNDLIQEQHPHILMRGIIYQLRGTGAEKVREGATLHDVLDITQSENYNWYQSGNQPNSYLDSNKLTEKIQLLTDRLEHKVIQTEVTSLNTSIRISETVQGIEQVLEQITDIIIPLLGATEAGMFRELIQAGIMRLRDWESSIEALAAIWKKRNKSDRKLSWEAVLASVSEVQNPEVQSYVFRITLDTVLADCGQKSDISWLKRYGLLEWSAEASEREFIGNGMKEYWGHWQEQLWISLAGEAMDRKAEARVMQLLRSDTFMQIRSKKSAQDVIENIKKWCFNRYDIFHAMECNRQLHHDAIPFSSTTRTLLQYAGHFAPVWLALLVGVIFMFDFGDPWFELAEIGDVGGVIFAFSFGVAGTFLYVWHDLNKKTVHLKGDPFQWISSFSRVAIFLIVALIFTALMVSLFWYMFSSTDQVVHGPNAPLHLLSWTGFALFVGVFLGLLGRDVSAGS